MHGRVEMKIREIRNSLEKSIHKEEQLPIIQWETIAAHISNSINNMPIAVRGAKSAVRCCLKQDSVICSTYMAFLVFLLNKFSSFLL